MLDLVISVVIPSVILMKFSGDDHLGATGGLLVALAFPIFYGLYELLRNRKRNYIAVLGVVSVLLTGGIGLLELDPMWLAVKEAAVPSIIGGALLIAHKLGYPVVQKLLLNPAVMDVERINTALRDSGNSALFDRRVDLANYMLAGTFVFSAIMNFTLARIIVTSAAGTPAFNEELGQLNLVSYPMIALPSTVMMVGILIYLWRTISKLTGLTMEDILHN